MGSDQDYFKIPALSNSLFGQLKREFLGEPGFSYSTALRKGSTAHKLLLEREDFNIRDYSGKERLVAMRLINAVEAKCPESYFKGQKEVPFEYDFKGWKCKMKADIVNWEDKVVTDFKTTRALDEIKFLKSVLDYGYDRQAAWYLDAPPIADADINIFRIIAVSNVNHECFVYTLHRDDPRVQGGREDYESILEYLEGEDRFLKYKANN